MTIPFDLRKLINETLSEHKDKDNIAKTYSINLRAVYDIWKQGIAEPSFETIAKKGRRKNQF